MSKPFREERDVTHTNCKKTLGVCQEEKYANGGKMAYSLQLFVVERARSYLPKITIATNQELQRHGVVWHDLTPHTNNRSKTI